MARSGEAAMGGGGENPRRSFAWEVWGTERGSERWGGDCQLQARIKNQPQGGEFARGDLFALRHLFLYKFN